MKKWQLQVGNWLTNHLKLPSDVLLELPRITTIGQFHAYIENHRGLILFTDTELQLKLTKGSLKITLLPEEILVEGTIKEIVFLEN